MDPSREISLFPFQNGTFPCLKREARLINFSIEWQRYGTLYPSVSTLDTRDPIKVDLVRVCVFHVGGNGHVNRIVIEHESQRSSVNRAVYLWMSGTGSAPEMQPEVDQFGYPETFQANKRHIGALARLGWLPSLRTARFSRSPRYLVDRSDH